MEQSGWTTSLVAPSQSQARASPLPELPSVPFQAETTAKIDPTPPHCRTQSFKSKPHLVGTGTSPSYTPPPSVETRGEGGYSRRSPPPPAHHLRSQAWGMGHPPRMPLTGVCSELGADGPLQAAGITAPLATAIPVSQRRTLRLGVVVRE